MPYFPVDDKFHSHPKAAAASLAAIGLWALAGSWANDHLTDGDIPEHMIASMSRGATELADELVSVGLWRRTKSGYRFHQWSTDGDGSHRNITSSEVRSIRDRKASGGALGNHRRWHASRGVTDPDCVYCQDKQPSDTDRTSDRSTDPISDRSPNPPTPPHPTSTKTPTSALPDGWIEFWSAAPRKDGKAPAQAAYLKALKKPGVTPTLLLDAVTRYAQRMARTGTPREKIKMMQGWLNDERWNDETGTVVPFERAKFAWEN